MVEYYVYGSVCWNVCKCCLFLSSCLYRAMSLTCVQEWSLMRTILCYTNTLNVCKWCLFLSSCLYRAMSCVQEWSLMRTIFCYTNTLWDLCKKKDIDKIEKMLRRAARFALNRHNKTSSVKEMTVELKVKEMMVELKWPTGARLPEEISRNHHRYKISPQGRQKQHVVTDLH